MIGITIKPTYTNSGLTEPAERWFEKVGLTKMVKLELMCTLKCKNILQS